MDVWYWPTHGIQRTKFKSWLKYADEADYNIVHLPLSPAKREIFNETAAIEKFFEWQGLPWGWHVVFFSLIDTPNDNLPDLFPAEILPIVLSFFPKYFYDIYLSEGLNFRLGTKGLTLSEIGHEAAKLGMTVNEVIAMPELDDYIYGDG